ncbi:MAG: hypothetical protein IJZ45_00870 [Bacteroidaceae bacterium]|nr:hypothetical protein [Bacteroidaceae bacterium]
MLCWVSMLLQRFFHSVIVEDASADSGVFKVQCRTVLSYYRKMPVGYNLRVNGRTGMVPLMYRILRTRTQVMDRLRLG